MKTYRNAYDCLKELYAIVNGEAPSLLNEDSGGDSSLAIRIEELINDSYDKNSEPSFEAIQNIRDLANDLEEDGWSKSSNLILEDLKVIEDFIK